jgi:hypothetical protein
LPESDSKPTTARSRPTASAAADAERWTPNQESPLSSVELSTRTRWLGAGFTAAGILFQALWLGLQAVFVSITLLVSYLLWIASSWQVVPRLRLVFALAVLLFLAHAAEEFLTGFQLALPELFGRTVWSDRQYLAFNGMWALIFITTALSIRPGRHFPVLIVLFFAVAGGVGNGVFHLLLVLQRHAYFPGAWTAPLCLAIGIWLLRLLYVSGRR